MITYVFERTAESGWLPRTAFSDNPDGVYRKMMPLVAQDYDQLGPDDKSSHVTGLLFVYFSSGKVLDNSGHNMPEVSEYKIEYRRPELVRIV